MCDVHLVPEIDELRMADRPLRCDECRRRIRAGALHRFVEGPLDDGSGARYRYVAHEDCYRLSVSDVGDSGCFMYGGAAPCP